MGWSSLLSSERAQATALASLRGTTVPDVFKVPTWNSVQNLMELGLCWAPPQVHWALQEEGPAAVPYVKDSGNATRFVSVNGAYSWTSLHLPVMNVNLDLKTDINYW